MKVYFYLRLLNQECTITLFLFQAKSSVIEEIGTIEEEFEEAHEHFNIQVSLFIHCLSTLRPIDFGEIETCNGIIILLNEVGSSQDYRFKTERQRIRRLKARLTQKIDINDLNYSLNRIQEEFRQDATQLQLIFKKIEKLFEEFKNPKGQAIKPLLVFAFDLWKSNVTFQIRCLQTTIEEKSAEFNTKRNVVEEFAKLSL